MSLGYASKLSYREDLGGQLGSPELQDTVPIVLEKVKTLADWALMCLMTAGKLSYVCSQNVDGLHLRSGVPRTQLAELHGNCFAERCPQCGKEYIRDFEMETVGFSKTGRSCTVPGCRGKLKDHILDWEDKLPDDELNLSHEEAQAAEIAICLGTSLQITPACNIPLQTVKSGGKLVIINLQKTPKDKKADMVLHARVDQVMALLMKELGIQVPPFHRRDSLVVVHKVHKGKGKAAPWGFSLWVSSVHGRTCPTPIVKSVQVVHDPIDGVEVADQQQQPNRAFEFVCRGLPASRGCVSLDLVLTLADAIDADKRVVKLPYTVHQGAGEPTQAHTAGAHASGSHVEAVPSSSGSDVHSLTTEAIQEHGSGLWGVKYTFTTQVVQYDVDALAAQLLQTTVASEGPSGTKPAAVGKPQMKKRRTK